ncbi:MAG: hypothetical protein B0A82_10145 [Alkalinema sp. CACIAM 70d]|nr:MAG: hypothetical protein B0A82_10145 [Alkalinema sp. CACIAM 70d]
MKTLRFSKKLALATVGTIASLGLVGSPAQAATLGRYTFSTVNNLDPSLVADGVSFSQFSYQGQDKNTSFPDGNGTPPDKSFKAQAFSDDDAIVNLVDGNAGIPTSQDGFFAWSIQVLPNYIVSLSNLSFEVKRDGAGGPNGLASTPQDLLVRASLDGFNTFFDVFNTSLDENNNWQPLNVDLSIVSQLQNLVSPTTVGFRIYPFNTAAGKADNLRIDNVGMQGEAIPTPALLPAAMLGLGSALRRKRKQNAAAV